jgi:hypothetical protein
MLVPRKERMEPREKKHVVWQEEGSQRSRKNGWGLDKGRTGIPDREMKWGLSVTLDDGLLNQGYGVAKVIP